MMCSVFDIEQPWRLMMTRRSCIMWPKSAELANEQLKG